MPSRHAATTGAQPTLSPTSLFTTLRSWLRPGSPRLDKFYRFAIFFTLLAAVLAGDAARGFIDDESGYVSINTEEFAAHPWMPYLTKVDVGHPMIYAWAVGVLWRIFGRSNAIAHISIWCYGAAALLALQGLMTHLLRGRQGGAPAPRWPGYLAAFCLFSTPLFISHVSQYLDAVPYTAFLLLMVLAWAQGRRRWVAVWGLLLALTRITGFMGVLGLGLFDLGYGWWALRRRSWRGMLGHMTPYFVSGGLFIAYWAIKLGPLRLPFNTFKKNDFSFNDLKTTRIRLLKIEQYILDLPRCSFRPLLWVIAAALLVQALRWLWRRRRHTPAPPVATAMGEPQPGPAAIYAALLASMLLSTAFYGVYFMFPNARWLISWHALLVLGGVHALVFLLGRWRLLAVPLLLAWCALQVTRWHQAWVENCPFIPRASRPRMIEKSVYTLDINRRKDLLEAAVRWIARQGKDPVILAAYPTSTAFYYPSAGYTAAGFAKTQDFNNLPRNGAGSTAPAVEKLVQANRELYVIMANFDKSAPPPAGSSQQPNFARDFEEVARKHPFKVVFARRRDNHDWLKIYRFRAGK